jgi:hypothetical protein
MQPTDVDVTGESRKQRHGAALISMIPSCNDAATLRAARMRFEKA